MACKLRFTVLMVALPALLASGASAQVFMTADTADFIKVRVARAANQNVWQACKQRLDTRIFRARPAGKTAVDCWVYFSDAFQRRGNYNR